jgi:hypothetical protein
LGLSPGRPADRFSVALGVLTLLADVASEAHFCASSTTPGGPTQTSAAVFASVAQARTAGPSGTTSPSRMVPVSQQRFP